MYHSIAFPPPNNYFDISVKDWLCVRKCVEGSLPGIYAYMYKLDEVREYGMCRYSCIFMLCTPKFDLKHDTLQHMIINVTLSILRYIISVNFCQSHTSLTLYIVAVRASITGWLTLHRQTKLVAPSGFIRLITVIVVFFSLHQLHQMLVHL